MSLTLIAVAIMLIIAGCAIVAATRDLVRVLIGLEVMFLGAILSLIPLSEVYPHTTCMLTLSLFIAAVSETVLMISILFRIARIRRRVTIPLAEKS